MMARACCQCKSRFSRDARGLQYQALTGAEELLAGGRVADPCTISRERFANRADAHPQPARFEACFTDKKKRLRFRRGQILSCSPSADLFGFVRVGSGLDRKRDDKPNRVLGRALLISSSPQNWAASVRTRLSPMPVPCCPPLIPTHCPVCLSRDVGRPPDMECSNLGFGRVQSKLSSVF